MSTKNGWRISQRVLSGLTICSAIALMSACGTEGSGASSSEQTSSSISSSEIPTSSVSSAEQSSSSEASEQSSSSESSEGGITLDGPPPLVYEVENTGADCTVTSDFPSFGALPSISEMPDPFLMEDGTRISSYSQWACRRAEIKNQIERWVLGAKPGPEEGEVTASFSGGTLTVNVTVGGSSVQLSTNINAPSGAGPHPALITLGGFGGVSVNGVASMGFDHNPLAGQFPAHGSGKFWEMFPDNSVGAYAGWAWGVSRIIDGLELTADQHNIDTTKIGVTGCSYLGKLALWSAAFDERIALSMPQESGGGGEASWRVMAGQPETEHLEAAQGTGWYSTNLRQFGNADAPKLPVDQHSLVAMIAPRAIFALQNTAQARTGPEAGGASMKAAAKVWEAMGVPERIGFSQVNAGGHCNMTGEQRADMETFVRRYLLGDESVDTNIRKDAYPGTDMGIWAPWDVPDLTQ